MGRPREHDERTRVALLRAAEALVGQGGPDALSVRTLADRVGTTTRAVYSLFGSKDGLIAALAIRAFEIIESMMQARPVAEDPSRDLTDLGPVVFRRFVLEHPALYRIAFQRIAPELMSRPEVVRARSAALPKLLEPIERCREAGLLGTMTVMEAAIAYNALCEGLANAELRGRVLPILPSGREAEAWRTALAALVRGFGVSAARDRAARSSRTRKPRSRRSSDYAAPS